MHYRFASGCNRCAHWAQSANWDRPHGPREPRLARGAMALPSRVSIACPSQSAFSVQLLAPGGLGSSCEASQPCSGTQSPMGGSGAEALTIVGKTIPRPFLPLSRQKRLSSAQPRRDRASSENHAQLGGNCVSPDGPGRPEHSLLSEWVSTQVPKRRRNGSDAPKCTCRRINAWDPGQAAAGACISVIRVHVQGPPVTGQAAQTRSTTDSAFHLVTKVETG